MSAFALALAERRWDAVALYLLIGACRAAALGPDAVDALLELLAVNGPEAAGA